MTHPLSAQKLFREEARWNGVFTKIDFLKNRRVRGIVPAVCDDIFLAGIADADGDVFIGHEGGSPL
jgi:hypothetical protein